MAAREVRKTLLQKAGEIMRIEAGRLDLVDREVVDLEGSGKNLPITDVIRACASDGLTFVPRCPFQGPFSKPDAV